MKRALVRLTLALTMLSAAGGFHEAGALNFSVNDDNPNPALISGSTYNGFFDISAQLPGNASITSATATFFFSDQDPTSYTGFTSSSGSGYTSYTSFYSNPLEQAQVNVVGQTVDGTSPYFATGNVYLGANTYPYTYSYSCGFFSTCYGTAYWTDYYYSNSSGYTGSWQLAMNLNAAGLAALATGTLNFSVSPLAGDFMFNDARLDVTYNAVPEPQSIVLLGVGLLALAVWLKKHGDQSRGGRQLL